MMDGGEYKMETLMVTLVNLVAPPENTKLVVRRPASQDLQIHVHRNSLFHSSFRGAALLIYMRKETQGWDPT